MTKKKSSYGFATKAIHESLDSNLRSPPRNSFVSASNAFSSRSVNKEILDTAPTARTKAKNIMPNCPDLSSRQKSFRESLRTIFT